MDKEDTIYVCVNTHDGGYSAVKKDEMLYLQHGRLGGHVQMKQTERQITYYHLQVEPKKKNEYNKETDSQI